MIIYIHTIELEKMLILIKLLLTIQNIQKINDLWHVRKNFVTYVRSWLSNDIFVPGYGFVETW